MAYPGATLLQMTPYGLQPTTLEATEHFRLLREFFVAPGIFVDAILE
jgi:predicted ATPase